jgi:hypothetical protein
VPTLSPQAAQVRTEQTEADRLAALNRDANSAAISRTQPRLANRLREVSPGVTWAFGRDGYLTAFEPGERWYAGCSVPLLAARSVLKSFEGGTGVACFLNPTHAGEVCVALDRLQSNQALICIVPDERALAVAIHCDDFSQAMECGRLWFASGPQWASELALMLDEVPGLPTPSRFVRLPHADASVIEQMIGDAQRVFADVTSRRNEEISRLRNTPATRGDICVIAPSTFRLWDDAGETLARATGEVRRFDPDEPTGCSPLTLARVASTSRAVVAANLSRADLASVLPSEVPLITWVTTSKVSARQTAGRDDVLLVADETWRDTAIAGGWPADRVQVAGWPDQNVGPASTTSRLAIIADTGSTDAPKSLEEFSSHGLLWETIKNEIARDPFAVPADVIGWLNEQARAHGIAPETLDATLFIQRLILPAYQQAVAGALLDAAVPLRIHGAGWSELPKFAEFAAGPITSRDELHVAALDASALVHVWPDTSAHPIDALGRPVVRRTGRRIETFVRDAKAGKFQARSIPPLSRDLVSSVLSRLEAGAGAG